MTYGGENASYNFNPNMISLAGRKARSEAFDAEIANDVTTDNPKVYKDRLKALAFALEYHEDAASALTSSKLVNLCFHLLRRLDAAEARIAVLEKARE